MKYLKFIFENQEVCALTDNNQDLINEATAAIIHNSINLEAYVLENIEQFMSANSDIADIYENIRNFAVQETIDMFNVSSEVIKDPELDSDLKAAILEVNTPYKSNTDEFMAKSSGAVSNAKKGIYDAQESGKAALHKLKDSGHDALVAADQSAKAAMSKASSAAHRGADLMHAKLVEARDGLVSAVHDHPAVAAAAAVGVGLGAGAYAMNKYKNRK